MAHKGPEAGANQEPPRTPQQQTGKVVADYNLMPAARGVTPTPPQAWLLPQYVEGFRREKGYQSTTAGTSRSHLTAPAPGHLEAKLRVFCLLTAEVLGGVLSMNVGSRCRCRGPQRPQLSPRDVSLGPHRRHPSAVATPPLPSADPVPAAAATDSRDQTSIR